MCASRRIHVSMVLGLDSSSNLSITMSLSGNLHFRYQSLISLQGQLLGKSDRDERDIVMTALQCAWRRWIDGVRIHLPHSARKRSRGSQHDFDPEEDTEQERRDVFVEDYDVHDDRDIDSSTKTLFGESIVKLLQCSEELGM